MSPWIAPAFALAAACALLFGIVFFGQRKPGYSHLHHTISELGEVGAPDQQRVAWVFFFPVGLLVLGALWAGAPNLPLEWQTTWWWFAGVAVGYIGAAFFPCDEGAPSSGSWRNGLHNLCGGLEYIGGGMAILHIAEAMAGDAGTSVAVGFSKWAGLTVIGALVLLVVPGLGALRGLIQRLAEGALFGWLLWMTLKPLIGS